MSSQKESPKEGQAPSKLALITPVQSNAGVHSLNAAGSFSDSETAGSVHQPKIKQESDSESVPYAPFTNTTSAGEDGNIKADLKIKQESGSEDTIKSTNTPEKDTDAVSADANIKKEPGSENNIVDSLPDTIEKGDLDPNHLQSSPVSLTSKDDLEPLPFAVEPFEEFPLTGPIANDFLQLYDSLSDDDKGDELSMTTVTSKSTSTYAPVHYPHHYYWPYHAMYPPHPYHAPHPSAHYPWAYPPIPHSSASYSKKPTQSKSDEPKTIIKEVKDDDVICGRGGKVNAHPGNKRFRQLIHQHKLEYLTATKQEKPLLSMKILEKVKPGRFLVQTTGGYFEACEERAREKASQALREGAAKLRKEGYGTHEATGGLKLPPKISLPNERVCGENYADSPTYCDDFQPPPLKKIRTVPKSEPKVIIPNNPWDVDDDEVSLPFEFPV